MDKSPCCEDEKPASAALQTGLLHADTGCKTLLLKQWVFWFMTCPQSAGEAGLRCWTAPVAIAKLALHSSGYSSSGITAPLCSLITLEATAGWGNNRKKKTTLVLAHGSDWRGGAAAVTSIPCRRGWSESTVIMSHKPRPRTSTLHIFSQSSFWWHYELHFFD